MSREESEVLKAAVAWWKGKRPTGDTVEDHLGHPTINTTTLREARLAEAVAMYVEAKR